MAAKKTVKTKPEGEPTTTRAHGEEVKRLHAEVTRLRLDIAHARRERDRADANCRAENQVRVAESEAYADVLLDESRRRVKAEARRRVKAEASAEVARAEAEVAEARAKRERDTAREEARVEREAKAALQARLDALTQ